MMMLPNIGLFLWSTLSFLYLILMCVSLYSILSNEFCDFKTKMIWKIGVIFIPIIGSIMYLTNRKKMYR
jgi:Phospholipase_D-nuclease N-terminal